MLFLMYGKRARTNVFNKCFKRKIENRLVLVDSSFQSLWAITEKTIIYMQSWIKKLVKRLSEKGNLAGEA